MHRCIGTEIKGIVLSPITVGGRFMKRIQDFLVIIQRLYIVQPSLLTREKKKKLPRTEGYVAFILLRMDVVLQQALRDQEETLIIKEN